MFETVLYLAFPLTKQYEIELRKNSPEILKEFIQPPPSSFLEKIESEGNHYLGKFLGLSIELENLEFSSAHLMSILKKLVPHFAYEEHPLVLLAINR